MPLIPQETAQMLRSHFAERLSRPVVIEMRARPDHESDARQVLGELTALSPNIRLEVIESDADAVPSLVLRGAARGAVRFRGLPSGYELATLLEDLVDVSAGTTSLARSTRDALAALEAPMHIQVFVTPTCPFCPQAARLAHQAAVESALVTAEVIDARELPQLAERYNVRGVPRTVINDVADLVGAQPEKRFVAALRDASRTGRRRAAGAHA